MKRNFFAIFLVFFSLNLISAQEDSFFSRKKSNSSKKNSELYKKIDTITSDYFRRTNNKSKIETHERDSLGSQKNDLYFMKHQKMEIK